MISLEKQNKKSIQAVQLRRGLGDLGVGNKFTSQSLLNQRNSVQGSAGEHSEYGQADFCPSGRGWPGVSVNVL